ncbi:MAG: DUF1232 domain-containing protein [Spirochaetales bacterium]|nr:DUF1232 domain-containing protein [Spirochaetales bacterium]
MEFDEKKTEEAVKLAERMADEAGSEEIEQAFEKVDTLEKDRKISPIWEKIQLLKAMARSADIPRSAKKAAIGALLYLVSPFDVIPDHIPGAGLVDDVFVVTRFFHKAVDAIKKNPEKALEVIDSLPPGLKKVGMKTFGVVGGAVVGAKMGAIAGDMAGTYLEDNRLADLYRNLKRMNEELVEREKKLRQTLIKYAHRYLAGHVSKLIMTSFQNRYRRGLEILLLYLLSILFVISPIFGPVASSWVSAILMTASFLLFVVGLVRTARIVLPYAESAMKERSLSKGILVELRKLNKNIAKGEKLLAAFHIELTDKELLPIVKEVLICFRKQIALYAAGIIVITLGFFLVKHALILQTTELSTLQIVAYPYYYIFHY